MKKIIIFGATGTIGAYSSLELKKMGYEVIATGRRNSDNNFFSKHNIKYYSVDITDLNDFNNLPVNDIDTILHCAGAMPSAMEGYHPQKYIDTIISGTLNVLEYARKNNVKKIIFTQTRADSTHLMGSKNKIPSDISKTFPLKGDHSVYTICKNAAVNLIDHYYHEYGLKRYVLRLPTIYAFTPNPFFYVDGKKKWMAYRWLMSQAKQGESIEIWGDPEKEKEIVYIKDLIQIFKCCIDSNNNGGFYNVGGEKGISLEEQIRGIVEVFSDKNNKSKILYRRDKPNARQFIHDISKTKKDLGYKPKYNYLALLHDFKEEMNHERFKELWGQSREFVKNRD